MVAPTPSPECPAFQFTTKDDFLRQIHQARGDILEVNGVDESAYRRLMTWLRTRERTRVRTWEEVRSMNRPKFRVRSYSANKRTLRLALLTPHHEKLHIELKRHIMATLFDTFDLQYMKYWDSPVPWPRLFWCKPATPALGGGYAQEPDLAANFCKFGLDSNKLPEYSLVILTGVSQDMRQLREDMVATWLRQPEQGKHVLLIKACPPDRSIYLERWTGGPQYGLQLDQSITIWPAADSHGFRVFGGPLRLKFRILFQRQERPGEEDLILDDRMLEEYANSVWSPSRRPGS